MNKIIFLLLIFISLTMSLTSCASSTKDPIKSDKSESMEEILDRAEESATVGGRKILETSRLMIANQEVIVGGCWNYINAAYDRAGYPSSQRATVFKSKIQGPYVQSESIQAGDWLYFVNHSYNDIEHSAIFVAWIDEEKKEAWMVNYVGEKHKKPATYKKFKIDQIYNIIRTKD